MEDNATGDEFQPTATRTDSQVLAYIDPSDPKRIHVQSGFQHRDEIKSLLAVRWVPRKKVWALPLAWSSCLGLRATFGERLVIDPTLTAWAAQQRRETIDPAKQLREAVTLDDIENLTPVTQAVKKVGDTIGLFKHQYAGAAYMATTESCIIGDETGTGKSAQTIAALRSMHAMGKDIFPVLIVAPKAVVRPWEREFNSWWPGLTVLKVEGGAASRRKTLETPAHVYIVNWEMLRHHSRLAGYGNTALKRCVECGGLDETITVKQCETHIRELNQRGFKSVIADECHRAKSPQSKQSRALWALGDTAEYRYALTGTPVQDNIDDLWSLYRFVFPDEYTSKTRFIERFANTGFSQWGMFKILGLKEESKEEYDQIMGISLRRMLKKVVLPFLPPIVFEDRYIPMTGAQAKAYKQMEDTSAVELGYKNAKAARADKTVDIESGKDSTDSAVATTPLARNVRLLQFASSYAELVKDEEPSDGVIADALSDAEDSFFSGATDDLSSQLVLSPPSNKINAVIEMLESGDFADESVIFFAQSRQLIDLLSEEMTKKGFEHSAIVGGQDGNVRQQNIDNFQNGETKYILVTISAGGVGLTLTAASTMVFVQRSMSSIGMKQAMSRAHRIGSERHESITVMNLITEGTVEEEQLESLSAKYRRADELLGDTEQLERAGVTTTEGD